MDGCMSEVCMYVCLFACLFVCWSWSRLFCVCESREVLEGIYKTEGSKEKREEEEVWHWPEKEKGRGK